MKEHTSAKGSFEVGVVTPLLHEYLVGGEWSHETVRVPPANCFHTLPKSPLSPIRTNRQNDLHDTSEHGPLANQIRSVTLYPQNSSTTPAYPIS